MTTFIFITESSSSIRILVSWKSFWVVLVCVLVFRSPSLGKSVSKSDLVVAGCLLIVLCVVSCYLCVLVRYGGIFVVGSYSCSKTSYAEFFNVCRVCGCVGRVWASTVATCCWCVWCFNALFCKMVFCIFQASDRSKTIWSGISPNLASMTLN